MVELTPWHLRYRMAGFFMGTMISMYVIFSNFGLASGNGLSTTAILALIAGGCVIGVWANRRWPAVPITVPAQNISAKTR